MCDINQMVERFLNEAVWRCRNEGGQEDDAVIGALDDRNQSTEVKRKEVLKWLRYYGVLRGLNAADREAVPSVIVEFADARAAVVSQLCEVEIIEKFKDLHKRCSSKVHPRQNGEPRSLISLTSKALWCCYPYAIPLFDAYAQRTLWVVSRLMDLDRPPDAQTPYEEYGRFVSVWLSLYRRATIDDGRLDGYRYKVRVFDRILWIIGQPDYGKLGGYAASAR